MAVPDGSEVAASALLDSQSVVSYHLVTSGHCWGGPLGAPAFELEAGDVLVVPRGNSYVIGSSEEQCQTARVQLEEGRAFYRSMASGQLPPVVTSGPRGGARNQLICGFLGCDLSPFNPLLSFLDPATVVRDAARVEGPRLGSLVEHALSEVRNPGPGSRAVLLRLSELMFVEVLRRCATRAPEGRGGWLAGLQHPAVGRALRALHQRPAAPWSLAELCSEAGVARSRLIDCFHRFVGMPPMQYLSHWRLQLAARKLRESDAKVATVAREVGFESEAAFSRAFKRVVGMPPSEWRGEAGR